MREILSNMSPTEAVLATKLRNAQETLLHMDAQRSVGSCNRFHNVSRIPGLELLEVALTWNMDYRSIWNTEFCLR